MKFFPAICLTLALLAPLAPAEPLLKPNDVIALVGGEDMVAAAEQGFLEAALVREYPAFHLKFRSLAWEGDTVNEQPRDLNYPSLEQQLDDIGATVVLANFGLMECLTAPRDSLGFAAAYQSLIDRLAGNGKRRVVLVPPVPTQSIDEHFGWFLRKYIAAIHTAADRRGVTFLDLGDTSAFTSASLRDGLHLNEDGQRHFAALIASDLTGRAAREAAPSTDEFRLTDAIRAKNRLWFHYARPQNWAFLNGDRTTQPSSRDHLDPSKRWFPEEMKQWLPLIAAKEESIWKLAQEMSAH